MNSNATLLMAVSFVLLAPALAHASTTGADFASLYTFVYEAATRFLGRSIAIVGGIIGLGMGAATGRALPAIIGIVLAVFGSLGPAIINSLFASAIV